MRISRRGLLRGLGALGVGALLPQALRAQPTGRTLRVCFVTDMHVISRGRPSDAGIAHAVERIKALSPQPDVIFTGGDNLTGTMGQELPSALDMRKRWERLFRDAIKIPMVHCIGNHDVWGWNKPMSKASGSEPLYGKNWSREQFQMDKLYFSREMGAWKIIVLDSVREFENSYHGGLDDEQFEWLTGEVKTSKPIVVLSHIPVTGISPFIVDSRPGEGGHQVPYGAILRDKHRVVKLFADHRNVKLVLGGHIHFEETVTFNGITYYNGGAVSGTWWVTPEADLARRRTDAVPRLARSEGSFSMLDLNADGTFKIERIIHGFRITAE